MKNFVLRLLLITMVLPHHLLAELSQSITLAGKVTGKSPKRRRKADIYFNFKDEDLVDVINKIAKLKKVNIVFPTGANAVTQKINYTKPNPLTLEEAWDELYTILDIAGYSLIKEDDLYRIVKNSKNISREPLPLFINTPLNELPKTDERIVYIYYLTNIKASQEFDNQLGALFKELLPEDALYKADKNANGILLVAKAQDIRSIMEIVEAMDQTGFQERLEMIRLSYTTAETVARIFNEGILKTAAATPNRFRPGPQPDSAAATYFSQNVRVIPEPRTNSLVVLGRVQAVERVKDFIFKYIDTQLDSGKSILHVYALQYLDADDFAGVLKNIIESTRTGGTEQSRAGGAGAQSGTERFFDEVLVMADSPARSSEEGSEGKYFGGNKLVIAARNDDWDRIRTLVETLDKPQPQVIVEVLIADLTLADARLLGSITRNPSDIPFPGNASIQAAMVGQVVLDTIDPVAVNALRGVNSDLNAITVTNPTPPPPEVSIPNNLPAGTTVISLSDSDGRTWSILEVLKQFNNTKILSHPHVIATNNQTALIEVGETRLVTDNAAPSTSGITIRKKDLSAKTNLKITPRISAANTVNLQVIVDIDQFTDPLNLASGNRFTRNLITNASVKSGDILALGGLVRDDTADDLTETPGLSSIPILGWFFKRKAKVIAKTSLHIFITPTIIQPKLRGGVGEYTRAYADTAKDYTHKASLFDNLRDPITRWFFLTPSDSASVIDEFLAKDATRDLSHPEAEFVNLEHEDDVLNNPRDYNKTGQLKNLLAPQSNPLQKSGGAREFTPTGLEFPSVQPTPQRIPAITAAQAKPMRKKTKIVPPDMPTPTKASQPKKGCTPRPSTCASNAPPCKRQKTCPAPNKKPAQHNIPCPVKKPTCAPTKQPSPQGPKPDLKNMLAFEGNPLSPTN